MADTFERSCEHWSESARTEMEDFYALATVDYRHLALARDWRSWFVAKQLEVGDRPLRLLDIACGSGKFPIALVEHGGVASAAIQPVNYALLDPAAFSIDETKRVLPPPFRAGAEYQMTLQELDCPAHSFDVVWATHALYALPAHELELGMRRILDALRVAGGEGFIAHSCADGHYIRFYRDFLRDFRDDVGTPYTNAEQIIGTLDGLGVSYKTEVIEYHNGAPDEDRERVEGYLQRCVFDDSVTLDVLLAAPHTGPYLASVLHDGQWRFGQRVMLISISV